MDVAVELGGVIGHLDADVARVHLGLALEGLLDLGLDPVRAHRRRYVDVVRDSHDAPHVPDHPLDLMSLVVPVDLAVERHPAGLHHAAPLTLAYPAGPF